MDYEAITEVIETELDADSIEDILSDIFGEDE